MNQVQNLWCLLLIFEAIQALKSTSKKQVDHSRKRAKFDGVSGVVWLSNKGIFVILLGVAYGSQIQSQVYLGPIIERRDKRLFAWKARYLLEGGKLNLIKSVLSNFPINYMSLLVAPQSVQCLEKISRRFFWSSVKGKVKFHLIGWKRLCRLVAHGDLGF